MRFCCLVLIGLGLSGLLCGCGSSSKSSVGPIVKITLSPSAVTLNAGEVAQLQVAALDARNNSVFNQTFTFNSSNSQIQVSNSGLLCAGTWDSLSAPVNCHAANPPAGGLTSSITATAQNVTSNSVMAFVHEAVAKLTIIEGAPPSGTATCSLSVNGSTLTGVPQKTAVSISAHAFNSSGQDISSSVGTFFWNISDATVASLSSFQTNGSNTVTAKLPGTTQIFASEGSVQQVNSIPLTFLECPVASIAITPSPITSLTGGGKTQAMSSSVVDSSGNTVSGITGTWTSSQPTVAAVNSAGLVTAAGGGTTSIVFSCTPNTCNKGLNRPVFSNVAVATVPGTPSTTAYVTCSTSAAACSSPTLIPINTSNNTAGSGVSLPHTPNSLIIDQGGNNAYLGSDSGLMSVALASNTFTSTVNNVLGQVLAVSPDGNFIVTSNPTAPGGPTLALYDKKGGTVTTFPGNPADATCSIPSNCVQAAFTPDSSRAYVAALDPTSGALTGYVVQSGKGLTTISVGSTTTGAASVAVLSSGAAAFFNATNAPFVNTCDNSLNAGTGGSPILLASLPDGSAMLGVDSSNLLNYAVSGDCPATAKAPTTTALGATVTPKQLIVTPDGKHAYVTSNAPGILLRDDFGGSATPIALSSGTITTFTGGSTPGSDFVYVGASDNQVHVIKTSTGADVAQVKVVEEPDLVAVKP